MGCSTNRFTIVKGMDNEFILTIKQTGTTLPMEIDVSDTFEAKLVKLDGTDEQDVTTTVEDILNGKIKLTVTAAETEGLLVEKGEKVDNYYSRPTYKLLIDCNTVNNGNFIAKVPLVYVE